MQTGAIDGQDNGFPATYNMKFHEVMTHMGTTAHLIAANEFTIALDTWNEMTGEQQAKVQECADNFEAALDEETLRLEDELRTKIEESGVEVYEPDNAAFQEHVLNVYKNSKYSEDWPEGLVDAIVSVGQ
jgi:TRAP-type C4-dicarboxylate transport system substrate-binding protein